MDKKGGAHEAISMLFQRYGVPPNIIVDGSKEETLGFFKRKVAEAGCHLRHTEPESPWQMAAKGGRKMTKIKSPKVLWDDCLELEAYIRSNMNLGILELDGMTPETNI